MVKRLTKRTLKFGWSATKPIRRPFVGLLEACIDRYVVIAANAAVEDANLGLDFAAAELARMQVQVEAMLAEVEGSGREGLAVAS